MFRFRETLMSHRLRTAAWFAVPAALLGALAIDLSSVSSVAAAEETPAPPPAMPQPSAPPLPQPPGTPQGNAPWRPDPRAGTAPAPVDPAAEPRFTMEELKKLVGPVALYPDSVLASLLPASAFPVEVVQAARFVRENGGKVETVPEDRGWDGSVVSMLQFPELVLWVDENLEWFERLGTAVALQQADVLEAIQQFRRDAKAAGNLQTNDKQVVVVQPPPAEAGVVAAEDVICIEPAQPEVVYIPVYDPVLVCRPPVYFYEPVITWSVGYWCGSYGPWAWYDIGWGWGWSPWRRHYAWGGGLFFHDHVRYWGHHHHHDGHYRRGPGGYYAGRAWSAPYRVHRASTSTTVASTRTRSVVTPRTAFGRGGSTATTVSRVSARPPTITRRPERSTTERPRLDVRRPAPAVLSGDGAPRFDRRGSDGGNRAADALRRARGGDDGVRRSGDVTPRSDDRSGEFGHRLRGGDDARRGRGADDGVPSVTPVRPAPRLAPAPGASGDDRRGRAGGDDAPRLRSGDAFGHRNRGGDDDAPTPAPNVRPEPRVRSTPTPQPDWRAPRLDRGGDDSRVRPTPPQPRWSPPVQRESRPEPRVERRVERPEPRVERSGGGGGGGRGRDRDDSPPPSSRGNGRRR
jgi:hypothetical protein